MKHICKDYTRKNFFPNNFNILKILQLIQKTGSVDFHFYLESPFVVNKFMSTNVPLNIKKAFVRKRIS